MKIVHTITEEDVRKHIIIKRCECCGHITHSINTCDLMGGIRNYDIGKRIANVSKDSVPIYQVENQEQLEKRTGRKTII